MFTYVEKTIGMGKFYKRNIIHMNFSEIPNNPFIFLSWVTAFGLFLSLTEATLKIKFEKDSSIRKRQALINNLYPKNLA